MPKCRVSPSPPSLVALVILMAGLGPGAETPVLAEADGPDAWRVVGVAADDVLNVRMGPGTDYPAIGGYAPDARHLEAITCVPLATYGQYEALSKSERAGLPPRWCLVTDGSGLKGWVAQRYLAEDVATPEAIEQARGSQVPPPWDIAVPLVRNFYRSYSIVGPDALRDLEWLRSYLSLGLSQEIAAGGTDADPLYGGQDSRISDLRVMFDPDTPVIRGMAKVVVAFRNFGQERRATVSLRADPQQGGAIRVFRIEHQDGQVVE